MKNLDIKDIHDIIEDFQDVKAHEFKNKLDASGRREFRDYVFSQWVTLHGNGEGIMRVVKPTTEFLQQWHKVMGCPLSALIPHLIWNSQGYNWIARSAGQGATGMSFELIAGYTESTYAINNTTIILRPPINQEAFRKGETWIVYNAELKIAVRTEPTKEHAQRAVDVLNAGCGNTGKDFYFVQRGRVKLLS